jgi:hypothetical protein
VAGELSGAATAVVAVFDSDDRLSCDVFTDEEAVSSLVAAAVPGNAPLFIDLALSMSLAEAKVTVGGA